MEEKLTKDEKKAARQEEWRENLKKQETRNKMKVVGLWALGVCVLGIVMWGLVAASGQSSSATTASIKIPPVTSKDFQSGPTSATSSGQKIATLVEYADFQCPACKAYHPLVKQLQADFAGKLHFVYRMFPLEGVHQNAANAAQAAYAASLQGKFWEMHDRLFETQDSWATVQDPTSIFVGYAKDLGLNTDQFKKDYTSSAAQTFVTDSYNNALNLGLNSTPTFFLNGKQLANPQGYEAFKTVINDALK